METSMGEFIRRYQDELHQVKQQHQQESQETWRSIQDLQQKLL
jgi:Sec-independent protein translocase protein TatA